MMGILTVQLVKVVLTGNGIGSIPITCHINFGGKNGSINY